MRQRLSTIVVLLLCTQSRPEFHSGVVRPNPKTEEVNNGPSYFYLILGFTETSWFSITSVLYNTTNTSQNVKTSHPKHDPTHYHPKDSRWCQCIRNNVYSI